MRAVVLYANPVLGALVMWPCDLHNSRPVLFSPDQLQSEAMALSDERVKTEVCLCSTFLFCGKKTMCISSIANY